MNEKIYAVALSVRVGSGVKAVSSAFSATSEEAAEAEAIQKVKDDFAKHGVKRDSYEILAYSALEIPDSYLTEYIKVKYGNSNRRKKAGRG